MNLNPSILLRGLLVAVVALGVSIAVVFAVPAVVGADHGYVVLTGSMAPAIAAGDAIIVDDRPAARISEGDVITFVPSGFTSQSDVRVTHRVVAVHERADGVYFETKGDANEDPDPGLVPADRVIGVVIFSIPKFGYLVSFVGTPIGKLSIIVVPAVILAVSEVYSLVGKGLGKQERER